MLSKIIDKRMASLGYKKIEETKYGAYYLKHENEGNYDHAVCVLHKASGKHIMQSYDAETVQSIADGKFLNEDAGVELPVLLLMWLKGKQMAHKYEWGKRLNA